MATRATYGFHSSRKPDITIYIHHDGYEIGAASYIAKALEEGGETLNDYFTVESFIRANGRAEITKSHEDHGDTEYRYDFYPNADHNGHCEAGIITLDSIVVKRKRNGWTDVTWSEKEFTVRDFLYSFGQQPVVYALNPWPTGTTGEQ